MRKTTELDEDITSGISPSKPAYPTGRFDPEAWRNGKGPKKDDAEEDKGKTKKVLPKRRSFRAYVDEQKRS
jgi:hypothetical protein